MLVITSKSPYAVRALSELARRGDAAPVPIGDLARDVRAATSTILLPDGYRVVYAGQVQQQETAFATLLGTLVLSVLLVYMLLVALYESFLTPLAVLFSIPVALVGAISLLSMRLLA